MRTEFESRREPISTCQWVLLKNRNLLTDLPEQKFAIRILVELAGRFGQIGRSALAALCTSYPRDLLPRIDIRVYRSYVWSFTTRNTSKVYIPI